MSAIAGSRRLATLVTDRERVLDAFLQREQVHLARACLDLARAFSRGGVLFAHGTGAAASDAAHVAVEFMHPVIVGKRALPALAPTNDPTNGSDLAQLARADDIALAIAHGPADERMHAWLADAAGRGQLCIALVGAGGTRPPADHVLVVDSDDPQVVQEIQETAYHVLWELVHVFFEHPSLLDDACITCGDVAVQAQVVALVHDGAVVQRDGLSETVACELVPDVAVGDTLLCHAGVALERVPDEVPVSPFEETAFLYPFLDRGSHDLDAILADVQASTIQKGTDAIALRRVIDLKDVEKCARALRGRLASGGRLLAFGNGGSATDAQDAAADALARGWPAVALANDAATVTAVANDVGFENVFARQLIALGRHGDIALAISTSGSSPNLIAALQEAHRRGMVTCAITGHDGGRIAELDWLDHLFVVPSDYVPRVQEAQATIYHLLLDSIGARA